VPIYYSQPNPELDRACARWNMERVSSPEHGPWAATELHELDLARRSCGEHGAIWCGDEAVDHPRVLSLDATPEHAHREVREASHCLNYFRKAELAEERAHSAERRAREQRELADLGLFARQMAHDVKNLLHAVQANLDASLRAPHDQGRYLEEARDALRVASDLARRVLPSDRADVDAGELQLRGVVAATLRAARGRIQPQIAVETELAPAPPVSGDPVELEQALLNLVLNAADAMERGRIVLRSRLIVDPKKLSHYALLAGKRPRGASLLVEVEDNGPGIDPELVPHIAKLYVSTRPEGSGIGLASVARCAVSLGGALIVDTALGRGTRMGLTLPLTVHRPAPIRPQHREQKRLDASLLVVDDEPMILRAMTRLGHQMGYQITACSTLEESLSAVGRQRFDAAIVDRTMPDVDGATLVRALRQRRPEMAVLVMSGMPSELACRGMPDDALFLAKPFTGEELRAALDQLGVEA